MAEQLPDSARLNGCTVLLHGCIAALLLLSLCTPALAADTTSPTKPVVTDDGAYTTDPTRLHATWTSSDPESGIAEYQYEIRLGSTTGTIVVNWTSTGATASVTHTGLNLTQGKSYFFGVKAKNGVALWSAVGYSNGIKVDATAPTAPGQPKEGSSTDLDYDSDGKYTVYWAAAADAESAIAAYELQEKAGSSGTWKTLTSTKTSRSFPVSSRVHNTQYFYQVRARNGAGLWGAWSPASDGILVDKTAPTTPAVTDDGATTPSYTTLHATWTSSDPESGITQYQYQITRDSPTGTILVNWTSTGTTAEATKTGLTLIEGVSYFFSVKAVNAAGLTSLIGSSDGIKPQNFPPEITAVAPEDGSKFYPPGTVPCSATATDANQQALECRFLLNGQILQDWSILPAFSLDTATVNSGLKTLQVDVRDPMGAQKSQSVQFYLFRKPLEAKE